jgi:hypothetical protein
MLIFTTWLLSSCVVPPSLDSSGISSVNISSEFTSTIGTTSQISEGISSINSSTSQTPSSLSSTSQIPSSLDLKTYFQVVNIQKFFNNSPKNATIQVRLNGQNLIKPTILQGIQLIANDFYEENLGDIQTDRVDLTIQLFSVNQSLLTTPIYGEALFVINETNLMIGIQLKEDRIVIS